MEETVNSVDDILEWEFLSGNDDDKENVISTDDYPIDIMLLANHTPESQPSEIIENEKMHTSTSVAGNQGFSKQVVPEKASARVKYDYIFEKVLSASDVSQRILVPITEAEKHFPRINQKGTWVQVYDINREKRTEWELLRNYRLYYFNANWKEYVKNNQLQEGDTVLFYKMEIDQCENNEEPPRYAVQIKRSVTRLDTCLDKLMNSKKSGSSEIAGNDDMQISTRAANVEYSKEVIPEGEALVKYDYLFKKKLTDTDVKSSCIHVKKAEAKEHFSSIQATDIPIGIRVYDNKRYETMKWKISCKAHCYISRTLEYVHGNNLKAGDSILFYKTTSDQTVSREPLPRYAVQFEKTGETIDTRALYIPLDELAAAEVFANKLGKFLL